MPLDDIELPQETGTDTDVEVNALYELLYALRDAGRLTDADVNNLIWARLHVDLEETGPAAAECFRRKFRD